MKQPRTPADTKQAEIAQPKVLDNTPTVYVGDSSKVNIDIARYFNVDPFNISNKEADKLEYIFKWAEGKLGQDERTTGNILSKVSKLEMSMGSPALNERRYDKMYNWVKLQSQIDDLEKQRQSYERRMWI